MNKHQEYAQLKEKIKELTAKTKQLEIDLINELTEVDGNKLETKYATFSLYYRPKWKYSDTLIQKEQIMRDQVKLLKKKEELEGVAEKISDDATLRCVVAK